MQVDSTYIQKIAETIACLLKLDVTVVDTNLKRVAGTGMYFNMLGSYVPCDSSFDYVLRTGECRVLTEVGTDVCIVCARRHTCAETAHICYPISSQKQVLGVLGLIAFDPESRSHLIAMQKKYGEFLEMMCGLISTKMRESRIIRNIRSANSQLNSILETMSEGMLLVGCEGNISYCNRAAEQVLGLPRGNIQNRSFNSLFYISAHDWEEMCKDGFVHRELLRRSPNEEKIYLAHCRPVLSNSEVVSILITLTAEPSLRHLLGEYASVTLHKSFRNILGKSEAITSCKYTALSIANSDVPALVVGEAGTGKDFFVYAIHNASERRDKPLVHFNCGDIEDALLEVEFFGNENIENKETYIGKLQLANHGSILLDEVEKLPLTLQEKLLFKLKEKKNYPIYGHQQLKLNVRVIATSKKDISILVENGKFDAELYEYLSLVTLKIPPLRERVEDINILIDFFLNKYSKLMNLAEARVSEEVRIMLNQSLWGGNVRELMLVIEYLVKSTMGKQIEIYDLPSKFRLVPENEMLKIIPFAELEKQELIKALKVFGRGKKANEQIAKSLGIGSATVYRKLKEYNL